MAIETGKLIVVDLELTCWDDPSRARDMEIIEIGLCVFDGRTGEIGRKSSTLVRPNLLEISDRCHRITGLTAERLKREGVPLDEALNRLRKAYPFSKSGWAAWGEGDRRRVSSECAAKGVSYPFADAYLNVAQLHALFARNARRVSLEEALGQLGMEFKGRPHSGADDAWNTARVLRGILGWEATA